MVVLKLSAHRSPSTAISTGLGVDRQSEVAMAPTPPSCGSETVLSQPALSEESLPLSLSLGQE